MFWANGVIYVEQLPLVSTADSAWLMADATFSMLRTFNCRTFQLDAHVDRIFEGCRALSIPTEYGKRQIADAHEDLVEAARRRWADEPEWRTCITASRGALPLYAPVDDRGPWISISIYPLRWVLAGKSNLYDGVDTVISDVQAIPDACFPQTVKHHNRIHFRLAEQRAGAKWPLLCGPNGDVAEFTGANVAMVYGDSIFTPRSNCLRGVSMDFVEELHGRIYRDAVRPTALMECDEAFATCTPFGILPIRSLECDGELRTFDCAGPVTKRLTEKWIEAVGCNFPTQARRWDQEDATRNDR